MNVPDILEALSCCSENERFRDCEACPYHDAPCCLDMLLEHAMTALIEATEVVE